MSVQGSGGFGTVYRGTWRGRQVAVKCLPNLTSETTKDRQYEALIQEIELCTRFDSLRLVKVLGACLKNRASACLIMELVEGGNLFQRIHDPSKARLTTPEILRVSSDLPGTDSSRGISPGPGRKPSECNEYMHHSVGQSIPFASMVSPRSHPVFSLPVTTFLIWMLLVESWLCYYDLPAVKQECLCRSSMTLLLD